MLRLGNRWEPGRAYNTILDPYSRSGRGYRLLAIIHPTFGISVSVPRFVAPLAPNPGDAIGQRKAAKRKTTTRLEKWCGERNVDTSFYSAACNATHGIAIAILSVCPSIRRVYFDKTKWWTADILIPHETANTLVFWHQQWLVGNAPFPQKYVLKLTHPLRKTPTLTDFRLWRLNRKRAKKFNYHK